MGPRLRGMVLVCVVAAGLVTCENPHEMRFYEDYYRELCQWIVRCDDTEPYDNRGDCEYELPYDRAEADYSCVFDAEAGQACLALIEALDCDDDAEDAWPIECENDALYDCDDFVE